MARSTPTWNPILSMSDKDFMQQMEQVQSGYTPPPLPYQELGESVPLAQNQITDATPLPRFANAIQEPVTELLAPLPAKGTKPPLKTAGKWFNATDNMGAAVAGYERPESMDFTDLIMFAENTTPHAISPSGARSRMQVLPSTFKQPGFGLKPGTDEDFEDTYKVEAFGREYAKKMHEEFGGDAGIAALAYNQGIGNAKSWLADIKQGKKPKIPLEGQRYVKRIQPYLPQDYSYLYPDLRQEELAATYRKNKG